MIWRNHRFFTAATVFFISGDPIGSLIASGSSTFPDRIEGIDYSKNIYHSHHRKASHWWLPYAIIMGVAWAVSGAQMPLTIIKNIKSGRIDFTGPGVLMIAGSITFCCALGAFLHILEDSVCGKVPLFRPNKKEFGIRLFKVRSATEDVFTMFIGGAMILLKLLLIGGSWTL